MGRGAYPLVRDAERPDVGSHAERGNQNFSPSSFPRSAWERTLGRSASRPPEAQLSPSPPSILLFHCLALCFVALLVHVASAELCDVLRQQFYRHRGHHRLEVV